MQVRSNLEISECMREVPITFQLNGRLGSIHGNQPVYLMWTRTRLISLSALARMVHLTKLAGSATKDWLNAPRRWKRMAEASETQVVQDIGKACVWCAHPQ